MGYEIFKNTHWKICLMYWRCTGITDVKNHCLILCCLRGGYWPLRGTYCPFVTTYQTTQCYNADHVITIYSSFVFAKLFLFPISRLNSVAI